MQCINYIWPIVKDWVIMYGTEMIKILLILIVGIWIINKVCRISTIFLRKATLEISLVSFFISSLKLFLRVLLLLLLLSVVGINATSVIAAVGASLVTVGLVFKDSFSNFASGIMIIINRPIRVGDYIEVENVKGTVAKIEIMFTTLFTKDDVSVIIPNFRLASNNIVRKSPYDICNLEFNYVILCNDTKLNLHKILEGLLLSNEKVLQLPPPEITIKTGDENEKNAKIKIFCEKRNASELETNFKVGISLALNKYNLEIK